MLETMMVRCPVCKAIGVYEPSGIAVEEAAEWAAIPCFFTPGCPGRIWPEFAN